MEHVSYALFDDADHARAAVAEMKKSGIHCAVVLHEDHLDDGLLTLADTGAKIGAREGGALGAAGGAAMGLIAAGPIGLLSGGALGAAFGLAFGAVAGASGPEPNLERLGAQLGSGKVLLVVECPTTASRERVDGLLRGNGGHVEHQAFV